MNQPAVDVDISVLTETAVREELIRACRERDRLDLRIAGLAARFAATDIWDTEGFVSAIDWIRFNCHMTSGAAANVVAVGEAMNRIPESVQATTEGKIGFSHLTTMTRTANAVGAGFEGAPLPPKGMAAPP